jgi:hypothetical protein
LVSVLEVMVAVPFSYCDEIFGVDLTYASYELSELQPETSAASTQEKQTRRTSGL